MFEQENNIINDFALSSANAMAWTQACTVLTIQNDTQLLSDLNTRAKRYKRGHMGLPSIRNWAGKKASVKHFEENKNYFYDSLMEILNDKSAEKDIRILSLLTECKGLAVAKASFLAVLCCGSHPAIVKGGYTFACLDSVNLEMYGIDRSLGSFNKKAKNKDLKQRAIRDYQKYVTKTGTSAEYWDTWCGYIGFNRKKFESAKHVSYLHLHWFTKWYDGSGWSVHKYIYN